MAEVPRVRRRSDAWNEARHECIGGEERYDIIVIGSGQAGTPLARALAEAGRRTALIEREHVGGTCINEGCTPTKTMVASARVAYLAQRGAQYGVQTGAVTVDMPAVRERKRRIVGAFRGRSQQSLEETGGLDLIFGRARFIGPTRVEVARPDGTATVLTADTIVLNTGARPSRPAVAGLEAVPALDSTSIMELDEVPDHLLVLGGGYSAPGQTWRVQRVRFPPRQGLATHREPSLGLMEVTTWAKRRQGDVRAVL